LAASSLWLQPWPLLRVTENLVVALCPTSANTAAAVYQFNAATLQICCERMREQRLENMTFEQEDCLNVAALNALQIKPFKSV
jgi:hypothetical protein